MGNDSCSFVSLTIVKSKNGYIVMQAYYMNPAECWSFETLGNALSFIGGEIIK